jgi:shikimate kinase
MIIVLIGYMGSGKSSIGRRLSKKLDYNLIDLDDYIIKKENASVKEIFEMKGEAYFRKKEEKYLRKLLDTKKDIILSLGGGTPCFGKNMKYVLKTKKTKSFYLKGSVTKLTNKLILKKESRPLIANIETKEKLSEFIAKHLSDREPFYAKSKHTIITDDKTKKDAVNEIISLL